MGYPVFSVQNLEATFNSPTEVPEQALRYPSWNLRVSPQLNPGCLKDYTPLERSELEENINMAADREICLSQGTA